MLALLLLTSLVLTTGKLHQIAARWHALISPPQSPSPGRVTNPPESSWPKLMRADLIVPTNDRAGPLGVRYVAVKSAAAAILARPWFGHGPANWIGAASEYCDDPFVRTFFQFVQFTHQDVLQSAVEWGLIGAVGWWGLLTGGMLRIVRLAVLRSRLNEPQLGATVALGAVLLQSQWDFPLQMAAMILNAAVLAGLCWSRSDTGDERVNRMSRVSGNITF